MCSSQAGEKDRWLPTSVVARVLGVSTDTVRNYIEAGRFEKVRNVSSGLQPRYQIARDSVQRFEKEIILDY